MEVDRADDDRYEYVTLACQFDKTAATVNLKVSLSDVGSIALRVNAIVTIGAKSSDVGAYEGHVLRDEAVAKSRHKTSDDKERIRVWLKDARAALIERGGGGAGDDKPPIEYGYYLNELVKSYDGVRLLQLSWKMKLQPIGQALLGVVQLAEVKPTTERAIRVFVEPLVNSLSAERRDRIRLNRLAAEKEEQLLNDNQRLLMEFKSVTERQKQYDQLFMAKFVKVLNEKKKRIAALERELSELKHRDDDGTVSMVEKPVIIATSMNCQRRRGCGANRGRGRQRKTESNNDEVTLTKKQRTTYKTKQCSIFSEELEQEQRTDDVEAVGLLHKFGSTEINNANTTDNISVTVDNVGDTKALVTASPTTASNPLVCDVFAADTQIDDMSDKSPQWLQNSIPVTLSLQPPVSHKDDDHKKTKVNVIDSLWAGLL